MTTDSINARERHRRARPVATPTHKFQVGVIVAYRPNPSGERGHFRVTRQLPDGGQGLQYRIRSERDGQERVVVEAALERAG
ncbi:hypothetical protein WOC76_11035 [Methylocystis sp. IM3]|jgi:hypothetical protein|uniref:hypothetical protein n=1 Tax=unclassified Methylocystis TaxID=2625913 RepID=UPI000FB4B63C|nr:MAG: hypothetical protein EKK29_17815 [Hyphomicrobiales bacterium]